MAKKILLLGNTGKMGLALEEILKEDYVIVGKNSENFNAANLNETENMIKTIKPNILINTVAFLGIDPCEKNPFKALKLNSLYPKLLANLSKERNFLLLHYSTDAVFDSKKDDLYVESDNPKPLNIYGLTKYGGDCFIQAIAKNYYILRLSLLFGKSKKNNQFIEKMFQKIKKGEEVIRIANDIVASPSYSKDIAKETKRILESSLPFGLYHVTNQGKATLFEIISRIINESNSKVKVEKASYEDFPYTGMKNINTPMRSEKINSLRHWKEAVKDYVKDLKLEENCR